MPMYILHQSSRARRVVCVFCVVENAVDETTAAVGLSLQRALRYLQEQMIDERVKGKCVAHELAAKPGYTRPWQ